MKKQTATRFDPINRLNNAHLTKVVDETLAMEFAGTRPFSTADLWNIQRKGRTMLSRRHYV